MALKWPTGVVVGLAAIADLGHGYAYGESIFGAEMSPLLSYLAGFTLIHLLIALALFGGVKLSFTVQPLHSTHP